MADERYLLEANGLTKRFGVRGGFLKQREWKTAVDKVSFGVEPGKTVALVGESGSGKSTIGLMLLNLLDPDDGEVVFGGTAHSKRTPAEMLHLRRELQVVFQDPYSSLNGRLTIRETLVEGLQIHKIGADAGEREERIASLMADVHLDRDALDRYPHEFSGGQRQRIAIARALTVDPKCIILDEPTSALDASVQSHILNLLTNLQRDRGLTYLLISHNLDIVGHMADRVLVMRHGRIVEQGNVDDVFDKPKDDYTKGLLAAVPRIT